MTNEHQHHRIVIFDSGVGGLSIDRGISEALPDIQKVYCSDNACFPYGTKDDAFILQRVPAVIEKLDEVFDPHAFVIACNTASTVALDEVRSRIKKPVIGVVPAIKPAAQQSHSKVFALLATPATVRRSYTAKLIDEFASDCQVILKGSSRLVEWAEMKLRGHVIDPLAIKDEISSIFEGALGDKVDSIVLGCTHFPLLQTELELAVPRNVRWLDSSAAIARRLVQILPAFDDRSRAAMENTAVFTSDHEMIGQLRGALTEAGYSLTSVLSIPS